MKENIQTEFPTLYVMMNNQHNTFFIFEKLGFYFSVQNGRKQWVACVKGRATSPIHTESTTFGITN